jgi:hypothetical protein
MPRSVTPAIGQSLEGAVRSALRGVVQECGKAAIVDAVRDNLGDTAADIVEGVIDAAEFASFLKEEGEVADDVVDYFAGQL